MKRVLALVLTVFLLLSLAACGGKGSSGSSGGSSGSSSSGGSGSSGSSGSKTDDTKLQEGKWPKSVYSPLNIDEFTAGKIVYTEFVDGHYEVYIDGCTGDDLRAWTGKLFDKGFRAHEYDLERIQNAGTRFNEADIYFPQPGSPYKLEVMWDFSEYKMSFEWYGEDSKIFDVHWEKDEDGDEYGWIEYNVTIDLRPLKTEKQAEGSFLGVKAEDLFFDNVRVVSLTDSGYLPGGNLYFYGDYMPTEEDHETFHCLLIDRLAAAGAEFYNYWSEEPMTVQEMKDGGIASYGIVMGGKSGLLMDMSEWGHFGDGFQISYQEVQQES